MGVPFIIAIDLDKSDPTFYQTPGQQTFFSEGTGDLLIETIELVNGNRFF